MTMQEKDLYFLDGKQMKPIAFNNQITIGLKKYALHQENLQITTACYRCYTCEYRIFDDIIHLGTLHLWLDGNPPIIEGHSPEIGFFGMRMDYKDINLPLPYNGSIVLVDNFNCGDRELAICYNTILELRFVEGILLEKVDHNEYAKKIVKDSGATLDQSMPLNPQQISQNPYSRKWRTYSPKNTISSNVKRIADYIRSHEDELKENYWWLTGYMPNSARFNGDSIINDSILFE